MTENEIIERALKILEDRLRYEVNVTLDSPRAVKEYCRLRFAECESEVFSVLWLDNRHRLIECDEMFNGTIDGASVYPREVAKRALQHNAAACILTHNHPSGIPEPSQADRRITERLVEALKLFEIRVLDHIIVGHNECVSFAERGLV